MEDPETPTHTYPHMNKTQSPNPLPCKANALAADGLELGDEKKSDLDAGCNGLKMQCVCFPVCFFGT